MPSLNWLGRAQNKNVLKPIFLYGSSLSVLPKVMNHWVNQTGFLWFLICLPLISWVACRDLIWDCLPFLYGSVESDGAEQEHFPVAAQGHAVPRDRLRNRICARRFFFRASFPEFASQAFCHLFVVPPAPTLSFNSFHPSCPGGCVSKKEPGNGRWWLAAAKQTAAAAGRPSSLGVAGGQDGRLPAPRWFSVNRWGRGEAPSSCGCSLLQRGSTEELEAMTFQALQMFAQWMWVSL